DDHLLVRAQHAVGVDHALRHPGRAGGEEDLCDRVGSQLKERAFHQRAGIHLQQLRDRGRLRADRREGRLEFLRVVGEDEAGLHQVEDVLQLAVVLRHQRIGGRDRRHRHADMHCAEREQGVVDAVVGEDGDRLLRVEISFEEGLSYPPRRAVGFAVAELSPPAALPVPLGKEDPLRRLVRPLGKPLRDAAGVGAELLRRAHDRRTVGALLQRDPGGRELQRRMHNADCMEIRRIAGALGAEIAGVDLAKALSDEDLGRLRAAWLEHLVLFFRDQNLSAAEYMAFARRIGKPIEYPFVKGIAGFTEIIEVKKLEHERINFGGVWHSDTTYLEVPPMASMLLAREVPPTGGDTLFANMYLAYESLSDGMKRLLEGLYGVNDSSKANVTRTREDRIKSDGGDAVGKALVAEHPVVRTHPETGRKALYVNFAHTARLRGMSEEESAPLLDFLFRHQVKPEFTCRFAWQVGSLALWDNRCAQHNPVNDYHGHRRLMHRITLEGDRPR